MAVKKTSKKTASIKSIKKEKSTNSENKLVERLQLKLEKSEEKIIELNERDKRIKKKIKRVGRRKKRINFKIKRSVNRIKKK